jgi:hypothetical protein
MTAVSTIARSLIAHYSQECDSPYVGQIADLSYETYFQKNMTVPTNNTEKIAT